MPGLPAAQRRVAATILEHSTDAALLSSRELARQTGASPSTVVRLARAFGYDGYPELQAVLQDLVRHQLSLVERLESTLAASTRQGALVSSISRDITALQSAAESLSPAVFESMADVLAQASTIYLAGLGKATAVVDFMAFRLRRFRQRVVTVTKGGSDVLEPLLAIGEGDVLVIVTFHRELPELVEAIKLARTRHARVIAVAEDPLSEPAIQADLVLSPSCGSPEILNSLAVPMAVAHALCMAVAERRLGEAEDAYHWVEGSSYRSGPPPATDGSHRPQPQRRQPRERWE
ncbi:MAG: MurR/RpiR family transcriptional regulator [Candidatus Limnocylindria bacterium]